MPGRSNPGQTIPDRKSRPLRISGIRGVGDLPWGTHFCHFYETKKDLLEVLIPYFKAGLQNNEFCLWVICPPLSVAEAASALHKAVPDLQRHLADGRLEIQFIPNLHARGSRRPIQGQVKPPDGRTIELISHDKWYLKDGAFDSLRVIDGLKLKLDQALKRGFAGMRVHGDEAWLTEKDRGNFLEYEARLNGVLGNLRILVLCTYSLSSMKAGTVFDVAQVHELATAKRHGQWQSLETVELKRAKSELAALKRDLERRIRARTRELAAANESLQAQIFERQSAEAELARVARWTMLGELTASIAHEINQPLAGIITNANASLQWLGASRPHLSEVQKAVRRIARDGRRAGRVIERLRRSLRKDEPARTPLNLNQTIRTTASLVRPQLHRKEITLQLNLAQKLPRVSGDRIQLEQVIMNLILNAIDAMNQVTNRRRVLRIRTARLKSDSVRVGLSDTGIGVNPDQLKHLFEPFFSTKPNGMGLGLAISRSIIEAHGGRLWASRNRGPGMTCQFTLPVQTGGE